MQGLRDAVSAMAFERRLVVMQGLIDSRPYGEIQAALTAMGVSEDEMPSERSMRKHREVEEYRTYHALRLQQEPMAMEASALEGHLANQALVMRARLQDAMLARITSTEMDLEDCVWALEALEKSQWRELNAQRLAHQQSVLEQKARFHGDGMLKGAAKSFEGLPKMQEALLPSETIKRAQVLAMDMHHRGLEENARHGQGRIAARERLKDEETRDETAAATENLSDGDGDPATPLPEAAGTGQSLSPEAAETETERARTQDLAALVTTLESTLMTVDRQAGRDQTPDESVTDDADAETSDAGGGTPVSDAAGGGQRLPSEAKPRPAPRPNTDVPRRSVPLPRRYQDEDFYDGPRDRTDGY